MKGDSKVIAKPGVVLPIHPCGLQEAEGPDGMAVGTGADSIREKTHTNHQIQRIVPLNGRRNRQSRVPLRIGAMPDADKDRRIDLLQTRLPLAHRGRDASQAQIKPSALSGAA
jgi:hypothetical protein